MKSKTLKYIRRFLLAAFLLIVTFKAYLHQAKGGGEEPSIHAICPYGGIESLYSLAFSGQYVNKIFSGTLIILILTLVLALIFRRSFCGYICPFGALQEFLGILGEKVFGRKFTIPKSIDKLLRYLKYLVLIITTFYAWKTASLWIAPYDPWSAYGHLTAGLNSLIEDL